jgi:hypothetical protein
VLHEECAGVQHDPRAGRDLGPHVGEQRAESRQQISHHEDYDADGDDHQDGGIGQSACHLAPHLQRRFQILGGLVQCLVETAAGLGRPDHADVDRREHLGLSRHRLRDRLALGEIRVCLPERLTHHPVPGVLLERLQRLHDGDARLHHDRQFAGDDDDLLQFDGPRQAKGGDEGFRGAARRPCRDGRFQGQHDQPLVLETAQSLVVVFRLDTLAHTPAARIDRSVGKVHIRPPSHARLLRAWSDSGGV